METSTSSPSAAQGAPHFDSPATRMVNRTLDYMYGTTERTQRTIGLAYLMLALGMILYSGTHLVMACQAG